ncbi:hypothetical protein [Vibrio sp. SCSIO 43136]|uniref:hypothetical protein n=1 Tax=Vibrio sp. SCSIO 43136 TaxID=2819101 RepID=UPI0020750FFA|nr:hypothetical protein [Vibrio sp. SCSIO 43136]USD66215.1 hypothetical protein J4N39_05205 [Vibrio sp. SCSIO 43136]
MSEAKAEAYPTVSLCHIESLSDHSSNFLSSRSRERNFLPKQGAKWWQIKFPSPIVLEQFISDLYLNGFYDEIEIQGLTVEIQTSTEYTVSLIKSLAGNEQDLSIENLNSDVITIQNDAHALLCNSKNSGALVYNGEEISHFEFNAKPSAWLVLEELSQSISIHDIVHFDPAGHLVIRGGEDRRIEVLESLHDFCK